MSNVEKQFKETQIERQSFKIHKQELVPVATRSFDVIGTSKSSMPISTSAGWVSSLDVSKGIKVKNFSNDLCILITYKWRVKTFQMFNKS